MSRVVFKVMKAGGRFKAMDYNGRKEAKGQARLIHFGNFGALQDGRGHIGHRDMKRYLEQYSARNTRIRNPQFHAILSTKGRSQTPEDLTRLALAVMEGLGYRDNPVAVYAHADTSNTHIHVVSSRVGPDGRKVSDRFEGVRAQRLIMAALGMDASKEFAKELATAMSYRFSSIRQFELLMELRGHSSKREGDSVRFFRHGTCQGSVSITQINRNMVSYPVSTLDASRVRGLILANGEGHDRELTERGVVRGKGRKTLGSGLTDHLHQRFGLQFVFFASSGHQRPYGYAIIDHANKAMYKGGDVLRMAQLTGEPGGKWEDKREEKARQEPELRTSPVKNPLDAVLLSAVLDELVRQVEMDAGQDARESERVARRRKRGRKSR
jgi:hypothetical protein